MGVAVLVGLLAKHAVAGFEIRDELPVGVLDEHAGSLGHRVGEQALAVNRVGGVKAVLARCPHVVFTECRRQVHDSGAVLGGDEVAHHHDVLARDVAKGWLVGAARQLGGRHGAHGHRVVANDLGHQRLGHHQALAVNFYDRVGGVGTDCRGLIGRERPRSGGPHQQ